MKLISLLLIFIIENQFINADIDCSIYSNELDIVNLNPFYVRIPSTPFYTSVDYDGKLKIIKTFSIINDGNPFKDIYCLKNLEILLLQNTNLTILPDIKNFQSLSRLTIQSDNGMINQHLPSEFGQLINLTSITLNDIKNLEDLSNEIEYLTKLNYLTLQNIPNFNNISDEYFGKLTNLTILNLIDLPKFSKLPLTMNNLQKLQQLTLSKTNIDNLEIQNLSSLTMLQILNNTVLTTIQIDNMLKSIGITIQNNPQLLTLKLQNVTLSSFGLLSNPKLISLDINYS